MSEHSKARAAATDTVRFEAEDADGLLHDVSREAAYWSALFPNGVKNRFSETVLKPNYSGLEAEMRKLPVGSRPLDLRHRPDLAIFPCSNSKEGRALAFYAKTDLAFAILAFLWSEAGWLNDDLRLAPTDRIAKDIGEMLVRAVRLGTSFEVVGQSRCNS
jgi:hypothetical protein